VQSNPVTDAFAQLYDGILTALPNVLTGLVVLAPAAVAVKLIMVAVRAVLNRFLPGEAPVSRQFIAAVVLGSSGSPWAAHLPLSSG